MVLFFLHLLWIKTGSRQIILTFCSSNRAHWASNQYSCFFAPYLLCPSAFQFLPLCAWIPFRHLFAAPRWSALPQRLMAKEKKSPGRLTCTTTHLKPALHQTYPLLCLCLPRYQINRSAPFHKHHVIPPGLQQILSLSSLCREPIVGPITVNSSSSLQSPLHYYLQPYQTWPSSIIIWH